MSRASGALHSMINYAGDQAAAEKHVPSRAAPALEEALAACQAAAYGYGVVGGHLSGHELAAATSAYDEITGQAEMLADLLRSADVTPPAARPAYALPFAVRDRARALLLARHLEDGLAGAGYDLVAGPDRRTRQLAVAMLSRAATRGTYWRTRAAVTPATQAFPGRP